MKRVNTMGEFDSYFLLDTDSVRRYAVDALHLFSPEEELASEEIGDGNINYVFRVRSLRDGRVSIWEFMSVLTHMYSGSVYVILILQTLLSGLLSLVDPGRPMFTMSLGQIIYGVLFFTYGFFFLFYYADYRDNGIRFSLKTLPVTVAAYVINLYVGFVSQVYGLIKYRDQAHWAKTEHGGIGAAAVQARKTSALQRKVA